MRTRIFPATGQTFSEIGLGTWQLGGTEWGDIPDSLALDTLAAAAEAGVTFLTPPTSMDLVAANHSLVNF